MSIGAKLGIFLAKVAIAILLGNVLFHVVADLPFDMPYRVDAATRWLLHVFGSDGLANPDDMEVVVGFALAIVTTSVGVLLVWGGHGLFRRLTARRRLHA